VKWPEKPVRSGNVHWYFAPPSHSEKGLSGETASSPDHLRHLLNERAVSVPLDETVAELRTSYGGFN